MKNHAAEPKYRGCVEFLRWALPAMGYAWPGFRRVRRQVCKRIGRRLRELHLGDLDDYRRRLEADPEEWRMLDRFCWIPISRFGRDWHVFSHLGREVLPELAKGAAAQGRGHLGAWCVGCARGEEPYTLAATWKFMAAPSWPTLSFRILATDIDDEQLECARTGEFSASSLKELPHGWCDRMFERIDPGYRIRPALRENIRFRQHDVREAPPDEAFDLILCRNIVFTYFDAPLRSRVLEVMTAALRPGGAFVIGAGETLPPSEDLSPWGGSVPTYRRRTADANPGSTA
jgi:chemotaxis protein methyltransferase CheR